MGLPGNDGTPGLMGDPGVLGPVGLQGKNNARDGTFQGAEAALAEKLNTLAGKPSSKGMPPSSLSSTPHSVAKLLARRKDKQNQQLYLVLENV